MNLKLPEEVIALDAQIKELTNQRTTVYEAWLNSVAPFKVGERVIVPHGRTKYDGVISTVILKYEDTFEYFVKINLKKGGTDMIQVYSWDVNKMERYSEPQHP